MVKKIAIVKSKYGIHARPSMAISIEATNNFPLTEITIFCPESNQSGNAKSILELLMLSLPCNAEVVVSASGKDEGKAADSIAAIIETYEVDEK